MVKRKTRGVLEERSEELDVDKSDLSTLVHKSGAKVV